MKRIVKNIIRSVGYDLHRWYPASSPSFQLIQGLRKFDINLVFDIGANTGQFAQGLRGAGYSDLIVSFEPLADAHAQLSRNALSDNKWLVHDRSAVGDFFGEIEINIAGNSQSSSVLPMLEAHSSAAAGSAYIARETTPMLTLDGVAPSYSFLNKNVFVKIDTQGFEWQVLDGGLKTVKDARGLMLELSLVPLYDGQRLWLEIIGRLESEGFTLWAIQPGFTDSRYGRTLQVDATFFRV